MMGAIATRTAIAMSTDRHPPPDEPHYAALREAALRALARVRDPEIGESLVALGLVAEVRVDDEALHVTLVPTSATCQMADVMLADARAAVAGVCPPHWRVTVCMDWDTVWTPERLSPELRRRFGW